MSAELFELDVLSSTRSNNNTTNSNNKLSSSSLPRRIICFIFLLLILFMISIFSGFVALNPIEKTDRQEIRSKKANNNIVGASSSTTTKEENTHDQGDDDRVRDQKKFQEEQVMKKPKQVDTKKPDLAPERSSSSSSSSSLSLATLIKKYKSSLIKTNKKCALMMMMKLSNLFLQRDLALTSPHFHSWIPHPNPILQNTKEYFKLRDQLENITTNNNNNDNKDEDVLVPAEFYSPFIKFDHQVSSSSPDENRLRKFLLRGVASNSNKKDCDNDDPLLLSYQQEIISKIIHEDLIPKLKRRSEAFQKSSQELFPLMKKGDSPPSTTWTSSLSSSSSRDFLWKCLFSRKNRNNDDHDDRRILFIGSSNTRTLMTNIQARLEGNSRQMSRVSAKQMCDNSATNHSCSVKVINMQEGNNNNKKKKVVYLDYIGYKEDLYHSSLKTRIDAVYEPRRRYYRRKNNNNNNKNNRVPVDVVIMSTGINTIQTDPSWNSKSSSKQREQKFKGMKKWLAEQWNIDDHQRNSNNVEDEHDNNDDKLDDQNNNTDNNKNNPFKFIWHSVSPLCPNMPHFRRYRFRKSKWSGQSIETVSQATQTMNEQVKKNFPWDYEKLHYVEGGSTSRKLLMEGSVNHDNNENNSDDNTVGLLDGLERDDRMEVVVASSSSNLNLNNNNKNNKNNSKSSSYYYPSSMFGKAFPSYGFVGKNNDGKAAAAKTTSAAKRRRRGTPPKFCFYYEDPLHHRFLDRAIVDVVISLLGC